MLNCKEVAHRADALLDAELGMIDRVQMRLHLMMCRGCAAFVAQMRDSRRLSAEALDAPCETPTDSENINRIVGLAWQTDGAARTQSTDEQEGDANAKPKG